MAIQVTTATKKLLEKKERIGVVQGGTSAGKTFSIIMILIDKAQSNDGLSIDVISQTVPHLIDGAVKDFKTVMMEQGYWVDDNWNSTAREYTFETNSTIKFKSVDKLGKAKGPRRDILFLNEANEMEWEIVDQLMARTRDDIWIDYNPSSEFWYHDNIKDSLAHDFYKINYTHNEALDGNTIEYIESKKDNKNWWRVYGLGEMGEIEGRIFTGWKVIDEIPYEARLVRRGLDFGYTNDPTAIVDIYEYMGGYIVDLIRYRKGLKNKDIADFLLNQEEQVLVVADSAEPKSIDEISDYGVEIIGATKGPGSISRGINFIQSKKISITSWSKELRREYESYLWMIDKQGRRLNTPEGGLDHGLDAFRYGMDSLEVKVVDRSGEAKRVNRNRRSGENLA